MRAWRDLVDDATKWLGPVSPALVRHWRAELDEVERRVALLECSAPPPSTVDGLHAFVALASARLADAWDPAQLIDVATAVELAHRASQHHRAVLDTATMPDGERCPNGRVVLDGDWSITQAAVLVADIGPAAYRCLVRGYGSTQVGQLFGDAEPLALMKAAVELAALVAGVPADGSRSWWAAVTATRTLAAGARASSLPIATAGWAIRSYVADGVTNARSVAAAGSGPSPIDAQLPGGRSRRARQSAGRNAASVGCRPAHRRSPRRAGVRGRAVQSRVVAAHQHSGGAVRHFAQRLEQSRGVSEVQLGVELQSCRGHRRGGLCDELETVSRVRVDVEQSTRSSGRPSSCSVIASRDIRQHGFAAGSQWAVVIATAGFDRMSLRLRVPQDEQTMHRNSVCCAPVATGGAFSRRATGGGFSSARGSPMKKCCPDREPVSPGLNYGRRGGIGSPKPRRASRREATGSRSG